MNRYRTALRKEHYFTPEPQGASRPVLVTATLRSRRFSFCTDSGVFSRGRVDAGTRLLAETVAVTDADLIIDWGCGYGAVGISLAAENPARTVLMLDVNRRACELASENCRRNAVANAHVLVSDGLSAVRAGKIDAVVCNPPFHAGKEVVHRMVRESADHLRPGGALWLVAPRKRGLEDLLRETRSVFGRAEVVAREKRYRVVHASR